MKDFIIGMQLLEKAGAVSVYALPEEIWVYGADVESGVDSYGFFWDEEEQAWVFYT